MKLANKIALTHHEKYDGQGYPNGLKGDEIPLSGRICAITDVFDALTMERSYKKAWSLDEAYDFIRNSSGSHFDPELVAAFEQALPEIVKINTLYSDETVDSKSVLPLVHNIKQESLYLWQEDYVIGNDIIDIHHEYLLHYLNDLHHSLSHHGGIEKIASALSELKKYTHIHFRAEEKMMEEMEYPKLASHIKLHQQFEDKINICYEEFKFNPIIPPISLVEYLKEWFINHICVVDRQVFSLSMNNQN